MSLILILPYSKKQNRELLHKEQKEEQDLNQKNRKQLEVERKIQEKQLQKKETENWIAQQKMERANARRREFEEKHGIEA